MHLADDDRNEREYCYVNPDYLPNMFFGLNYSEPNEMKLSSSDDATLASFKTDILNADPTKVNYLFPWFFYKVYSQTFFTITIQADEIVDGEKANGGTM